MPRFPNLATRTGDLPPGSFTSFGQRLARERERGTLIPLHIGDTHLMPAEPVPSLCFATAADHRYAPVAGTNQLRAAIADELLPSLGLDLPADAVLISPGATGGLYLCAAALLDPGDEIVVLTPSWPLILGIVPAVGGRVIPVAVGDSGWPDDSDTLAARIEAAITPRTVAIYFSDPNNPVGYLLTPAHRRAIAAVAARHRLWVWHDAVYAQLHWSDTPVNWAEHVDADRLITAGSFSKAYALAGHRVGYLALPESLRGSCRRLITHVSYHTSTSGQALALAALRSPTAAATMRAQYQQAAELTRQHLDADFHQPEGGAFVFIDLRSYRRPPAEILLDCLDRHVALAPGSACGADFAGFARLCYTAVPEAVLRPALESISEVLRR